MDEADRADQESTYKLQEALRARRPAGPEATGECLFCGNGLTLAGQRWCGVQCRDDWERQQPR
jgi:hypothetical protein